MWNNWCSRPAGALLAASLAGCSSPEREEEVARVGASSLTRLELEAQLPGDAGLEQRRRFVGDWVRRQLLYQEALERQVHERPRIQRLVEQSREDVIVAAYLDSEFEGRSIEIDPGEVQSYYDRNPGEFTRQEDEIRAQHIQVDSRRAAESLRQELLRDGGFDGRVAEVSLDEATAASSGDLGYFTARERPELWEACVDLRPGEVSDVVATGRGWHIARLRDRQRAGSLRSLDEAGVRQNIEEALVREGYKGRIQALVDSLREEHSWEIDETMLRGG